MAFIRRNARLWIALAVVGALLVGSQAQSEGWGRRGPFAFLWAQLHALFEAVDTLAAQGTAQEDRIATLEDWACELAATEQASPPEGTCVVTFRVDCPSGEILWDCSCDSGPSYEVESCEEVGDTACEVVALQVGAGDASSVEVTAVCKTPEEVACLEAKQECFERCASNPSGPGPRGGGGGNCADGCQGGNC